MYTTTIACTWHIGLLTLKLILFVLRAQGEHEKGTRSHLLSWISSLCCSVRGLRRACAAHTLPHSCVHACVIKLPWRAAPTARSLHGV